MWPSPEEYEHWKGLLLADAEWNHQYEWSQKVRFPDTPDDLALELIFVICNSGMHHKAARSIFEKITATLSSGLPITKQVFGHDGKVAAMKEIWETREHLHNVMQGLSGDQLVEFCGGIPWIGKITKYHAAKNLGADVVKPDRWLERIAKISGETPHDLCQRLAYYSGDRIGTVDLILWWASANKHIKELIQQ